MMKDEIIKFGSLDSELEFNYSRSGGPGGQNVNKVNSRVELRFDIEKSHLINSEQKGIILKKIKSRINNLGILYIASQTDRSQLANKENVIHKFYELLNKALRVHKKRKETKPGKAAIEKRLQEKRENSDKKTRRKMSDET